MPQTPLPPTGEIILYPTEDGRTRVECRFSGDTVWLSQALLAELYQKDVRTINEHLQNIYEEGELDRSATVRKFRIVRREGGREVARHVEHYNLAAILAVGYRVRSPRGVQFRRWATERLSEYLVKGSSLGPGMVSVLQTFGDRGQSPALVEFLVALSSPQPDRFRIAEGCGQAPCYSVDWRIAVGIRWL